MKFLWTQRGPIAYTQTSTPTSRFGDCISCGADWPVILQGVRFSFPDDFNVLLNPVCMKCLKDFRIYRPCGDQIEFAASKRNTKNTHRVYNILALLLLSDMVKMVLRYVNDDADIFEHHLAAFEKNVAIVGQVGEVLPNCIAMIVARMTA